MTVRIVAISAGLSEPFTTRMLADRIGEATQKQLGDATVEIVTLREFAHDIADANLTGFASPRLQHVLDDVMACRPHRSHGGRIGDLAPRWGNGSSARRGVRHVQREHDRCGEALTTRWATRGGQWAGDPCVVDRHGDDGKYVGFVGVRSSAG